MQKVKCWTDGARWQIYYKSTFRGCSEHLYNCLAIFGNLYALFIDFFFSASSENLATFWEDLSKRVVNTSQWMCCHVSVALWTECVQRVEKGSSTFSRSIRSKTDAWMRRRCAYLTTNHQPIKLICFVFYIIYMYLREWVYSRMCLDPLDSFFFSWTEYTTMNILKYWLSISSFCISLRHEEGWRSGLSRRPHTHFHPRSSVLCETRCHRSFPKLNHTVFMPKLTKVISNSCHWMRRGGAWQPDMWQPGMTTCWYNSWKIWKLDVFKLDVF